MDAESMEQTSWTVRRKVPVTLNSMLGFERQAPDDGPWLTLSLSSYLLVY